MLESWLIPAPGVRPPRDTWATDPQFQTAQAQAAQIPPELKAAHFTAPDEADECLVVLAQSFVTNLFGSTLPVPSYDEWMLPQDMRPTYARYADNLRLIGADAPGPPWLLKDPSTMLSIDAFLDVFPGARVLQTHRDPFEAMASLVSVLTGVRAAMGFETASVVERELAHLVGSRSARCRSTRVLRRRVLRRAVRIADRDPVATINEIYAMARSRVDRHRRDGDDEVARREPVAQARRARIHAR